MGCGESKHDVATGNTITRRQTKRSEETSPEKPENLAADIDNVKNIIENRENDVVETERLISKDSPHRFFSSRKEEDVEGEGRSDKSETFYSPRVESGKETLFNSENGKMNEEKLVHEAKQGNKDETTILKEELVEEAKTSSSIDKTIPALEKKVSEEKATATVPATEDGKAI